MNRRLRALGLCLLALCGLTAIMAASAQANWLEKAKEIHVNLKVVAATHEAAKLLVKSLNLEIRCTTLAASDILLLALKTIATGFAEFSGCTSFQISDGKEQKNCKPSEPIVAGGRALIQLYALTKGGALLNVILFEQEGTKPFTTITLPELCALAETSDVTGSLVAECGILDAGAFVQEDCKTERVLHLLRAPDQAGWFETDLKGGHVEVKDEIKFGENKAVLDGIADVELSTKEVWGGHV